MKRYATLLTVLVALLALVVGCATPTPEVIEKIVEKEVTKVVEVEKVVKETVEVEKEVEVTKVVEKEVEVTKVVEVEVEKELAPLFWDEEKGENRYRVERAYGSFQRSIVLPCEVDADGTEATMVRGVLTVKLPKTGEAQGLKQIVVTSAAGRSHQTAERDGSLEPV